MRGSASVRRALACVLVGASVAGCAYVSAVPVKPGSKVSGIRIYDVKPLLLVNGSTTEVITVPNYNRAYALQFGAFLAKNNFTATMSNGVLSNVTADMDSTEFIKVITALIEKFPIPAAGTALSGETKTPKGGVEDRFQVFDIVFDDDGNLVALRPLIVEPELLGIETTRTAATATSGTVVVGAIPTPAATPAAPIVAGPITNQ